MLRQTEERAVSQNRLTDWIVPPVIVPLFLLLLVLAAVIWRG
jgi:hypothetical protein